MSSRLNADAEPFVPSNAHARARAGEEERSLFMTFSNGMPLQWQEISDHFTSAYGDEVEYVYVHRNQMFGRIIFSRAELPRMILGNNEVVRIIINDKPVWLKQYVSQSNRNNES